ncbi:hypothetical protein D3C85_1057750 [compost metagenome]
MPDAALGAGVLRLLRTRHDRRDQDADEGSQLPVLRDRQPGGRQHSGDEPLHPGPGHVAHVHTATGGHARGGCQRFDRGQTGGLQRLPHVLFHHRADHWWRYRRRHSAVVTGLLGDPRRHAGYLCGATGTRCRGRQHRCDHLRRFPGSTGAETPEHQR